MKEPSKEEVDAAVGYEKLSTGKCHVSYSEAKMWKECSFRHKLEHVDKVGVDQPGVHMDFGTAIHSACENFLRTGAMDDKVFKMKLHELWKKNQELFSDVYTIKSFKQFAKEGLSILPEVHAWFDTTFPGWKFVDAEHLLYEGIEGQPHAFKGYIDCIIEAPTGGGKTLYWLLDFKTCSWGWPTAKKNDELVKMQLILYKNFWSKKTNVDPKNVRCGFVLLKRAGKDGQRCELVTTSVGEVTTKRSLTVINNMISSLKKGVAIKNRNSCTFCQFHQTKWCT